MSLRRVPPLPVALALVALALIAATWTTRSAVVDAYAVVRDGQALGAQQAIRADLADLGGPPSREQLDVIVRERSAEGVRYLAVFEGRQVAAEAGTATIEASRRGRRIQRGGPQIQYGGSRMRIEVAGAFRRAWGGGNRPWRIVLEVEPTRATALRAAATRTLAIGAVAALVLLGMALWLVRTELRRRAREHERERERRLASLGEMSAVLAHEIRNPLASLKGNAQLLAASLPEGDKPRAKAERVVDEAIRLERLTRDLLAFVRTGELARAPVEVGTLAREAVAAISGATPMTEPGGPAPTGAAMMEPGGPAPTGARMMEPGGPAPTGAPMMEPGGPAPTGAPMMEAGGPAPTGAIVVDVERAPATWSLDPARMHQVLVNLLENAIAAGPPARLRIASERGALVIEVSDCGTGVAAEDRDKVFEPFFTNKTRGTGLGLAIARRVVELHRGTLTVGDAPGGGALFRIEIPEA